MASEEVLTIFPPEEPVNTLLTLSGSKSFMNRALILGALADSPSLISNPSRSEDSITLLRLLKVFGVESRWKEGGALELSGRKKVCTPSAETVLDVGPAGTVMRFITSYAAAFEGSDVIIRGSERMHQRPIGALVDTLMALGANIEYIG
ncbi:MAG: hypothetical protein KDD70_18695, partial [Bdellovibrionales bacterium]|nr:hypothetical protein [Bdellovibrionales bacterium]